MDFKNYIPKGDLEGFPIEIIKKMLECQVEQGNPENIEVFEQNRYTSMLRGGFTWEDTKDEDSFWNSVLVGEDYYLFFQVYPKQEETEIKDGVLEKLIEEYRQRSETGIKKYGVTLDRDDLELKDWVRHAREEAMDLSLYLTKIEMLLNSDTIKSDLKGK